MLTGYRAHRTLDREQIGLAYYFYLLQMLCVNCVGVESESVGIINLVPVTYLLPIGTTYLSEAVYNLLDKNYSQICL